MIHQLKYFNQEKYFNLHVIHFHMNSRGLFQDIKMSQQRFRGEHGSILAGLDQHLVDAAVVLAQGVLHVLELPVQPPALLHPQLLDPVLHHHRLEANTEGGQYQEASEQNFARMFLN